RPKKLTRRSASPSEKVFKMMASVSLAGMSCRRADAFPDNLQTHVRTARTRRTNLITTHADSAQCLRNASQENHARQSHENRGTSRHLKLRVIRDFSTGPGTKSSLPRFC